MFNNKSKIVIFLDFDGVLCDSVKEAYILARYAYDDISFTENINKQEYEKFYRYRYLITHSLHFYYILKLIRENISDNLFENKYYKLIKNVDEKVLKFDKKYVSGRELLIKTNYQFWDNLDSPYDFYYQIKNLDKSNKYQFIILSNKKKLPIQKRLKKWNAPNWQIYANEDLVLYENKAGFISEYLKKNNINKAIFIDDSLDNLEHCKQYVQIQTILPDWGYINPKSNGLNQLQILNLIKNIQE